MKKFFYCREQINILNRLRESKAAHNYINSGHASGRTGRKILAAACLAVLCLTACGGEDKYSLRESAVALYEQGDYQNALDGFNAALDASNGQVSELQFDILRYKAECQLRLGEYEEARKSYEALLQLDEVKENQTGYNEVVNQLEALDKISAAKKLFEAGSYKEAADILKDYASLDDGTVSGSTAWYDMAICEEYQGQFDEAAAHLKQYLEKYPEDEAADKEYRLCATRGGAEQTDEN